MKYFSLCLMAVLVTASFAMAEMQVSMVDNGYIYATYPYSNPQPVLHRYTVWIDSGSFKSFEGVCLVNDDGTPAVVHNSSLRSGIGGCKRESIMWATDVPCGYETEGFALADTRFLIDEPGTIYGTLTDTDNDTNPANIEDYGGGASGVQMGWGTFVGGTGTEAFGFTTADAIVGPAPFMQVVVPVAHGFCLRGSATDLDGGTYYFNVRPTCPEPGTIIMLLAGVGSLLTLRFRKKETLR